MAVLTSIELCAGAGGQALGLEGAKFSHEALVEIDTHCCNTLRHNRPLWNVIEGDVSDFSGKEFKGLDLLAGGLPCPPFSVAGKQLGKNDERNLFPDAIRLVDEIQPKAVMIENVRGFLSPVFEEYRNFIRSEFKKMGYIIDWKLLNASDYGVPQLRPRVVIVAIKNNLHENFYWPKPIKSPPLSVGDTLYDLMFSKGWKGADEWKEVANKIAPTIVGGSKKHGGPDLGPTRAKRAWEILGVNGKSLADDVPDQDFEGLPRLTVRMVARLQGFNDDWHFTGKKTPAYRQVGNAFPPPVAHAVGKKISQCLKVRKSVQVKKDNQWQSQKELVRETA